MSEPGWIICVSRCLWCGQPGPHDLCHKHNPACGGEMDGEPDWVNFDADYEECDDPACPASD